MATSKGCSGAVRARERNDICQANTSFDEMMDKYDQHRLGEHPVYFVYAIGYSINFG